MANSQESEDFVARCRLVASVYNAVGAFYCDTLLYFNVEPPADIIHQLETDNIFHILSNSALDIFRGRVQHLETALRLLHTADNVTSSSRFTPLLDSFITTCVFLRTNIAEWIPITSNDPAVLAEAQAGSDDDEPILANGRPDPFREEFDVTNDNFDHLNIPRFTFKTPESFATTFTRLAFEILYALRDKMYHLNYAYDPQITVMDKLDFLKVASFLERATAALNATPDMTHLQLIYFEASRHFSMLSHYGKMRTRQYFRLYHPTIVLQTFHHHTDCMSCQAHILHCDEDGDDCDNPSECEKHSLMNKVLEYSARIPLKIYFDLSYLMKANSIHQVFSYFYFGHVDDYMDDFNRFYEIYYRTTKAISLPDPRALPLVGRNLGEEEFVVFKLHNGFSRCEYNAILSRVNNLIPQGSLFNAFLAIALSGSLRLARKFAASPIPLQEAFVTRTLKDHSELEKVEEVEPVYAAAILDYIFTSFKSGLNIDLKACFAYVREVIHTPISDARPVDLLSHQMLTQLSIFEDDVPADVRRRRYRRIQVRDTYIN